MYKFSNNSLRNIDGVHPDLKRIAGEAIRITLIDFGYGRDGGLRTAERQAELYAAGGSECDGFAKRSKHQDGLALDFYAYIDGKASWEPEHLAMVAAAHLQAAAKCKVPVRWGGLWRRAKGGIFGWDMAHIEMVDQ